MKTNFFKLSNGIRVIIVPLKGLKSVTVEAFLKIGAKYESKEEAGMSHFLEHMAFKGTKKRPTASLINQEMDIKGANYNAGTGHEATSYHITTVKENIPWAIEMIADMLFNSIYTAEEVLKERGVIMEEIKMYQDNPMMGLSEEMIKFLYGKSDIGCWNISGEVSDIKDINRKKVLGFRNKFINPENMVVVIAGNVDLKAIDEVEKYFNGFSNSSVQRLPEVKVVLNEEFKKEIKKETEQGHFAMAVPAIAWTDKRKYAFKLLDIIISDNSSSRLYQKIREDKGLAYYVFSISESFEETGFWGVQSGVKLERMDEAMAIVEEELKGIVDNLTEEELRRAKNYLIGKTELLMDRTDYVAGFVGQKLLLENELKTIDSELNRYKKTSLIELKTLAREIFVDQKIKRLIISNK